MTTTLRVHLSDACTDVLVSLVDQPDGHWATPTGVATRVAPPDADDALASVCAAMSTLRGCGLIEGKVVDGWSVWRATDAGRTAVAEARAKASTRPDRLPDNDESRGHGSVR